MISVSGDDNVDVALWNESSEPVEPVDVRRLKDAARSAGWAARSAERERALSWRGLSSSGGGDAFAAGGIARAAGSARAPGLSYWFTLATGRTG